MNKDLYEWEYEKHRTRNQRKRSKEKVMLTASVLAWAIAIVAVVAVEMPFKVDEGKDSAPVQNAPEAQETAVVAIPQEVVLENETAAETVTVSDEPDLDKLPMIENATLTHYCICKKCCGKDPDHPAYGITASGRPAEPYVSVAVDPIMIELGSKVYVDYGDGVIHEYRADDTGNFGGAKIDLCVSDHQEALELGIKTVKVWYER